MGGGGGGEHHSKLMCVCVKCVYTCGDILYMDIV